MTHKLLPPILITCSSCFASIIVDKSRHQKIITYQSKLNADSAQLELKKTGVYSNKPFEIIGRIRSITTTSICNEWLLYVNENEYYWLSETGLNYFIYDKEMIQLESNRITNLSLGDKITIAQNVFTLVEITKQNKPSVFGEIPFDCYNDIECLKLELIAKDNAKFASVTLFNDKTNEISIGKKIDLKDLNLVGFKDFIEWQ